MEYGGSLQFGTLHTRADEPARITSAGEFVELLARYPESPQLYAGFGDYLLAKRQLRLSAKSYAKAAALHRKCGETLQSIAALLMAWRLVTPSAPEMRSVYLQLRKSGTQGGPVNRFLFALRYREWISVVSAMRVDRRESGHILQKFGEVENDLFFVFSGKVQITRFASLASGGNTGAAETITLGRNDRFGNVFPLEQESISFSSVKTVTPVGLIRIRKTRLADICRQYPGVVTALERLLGPDGNAFDDRRQNERRKASRRPITVLVRVEMAAESAHQGPLHLGGRSLNIGIGGLCMLVETGRPENFPGSILGREVEISFCLPDQTVSMNIRGSVAWARSMEVKGAWRPVVGVRFTQVSPQASGYLMAFAEMVRATSTDATSS